MATKNRRNQISQSAIWVLSIIICLSSMAASFEDKCAACNAVAGEIEIGLSSEKPRNHVDLRHRLDSKGKREGKLIDYRVSELRVVELLDGLCSKMQDYTLLKLNSGKREWVKIQDWDDLKSDKQEARAYSKRMSSFCGRLLEETEDELSGWIKKGSVKPGEVRQILCQDLSKHCKPKRVVSSINLEDGRDEL